MVLHCRHADGEDAREEFLVQTELIAHGTVFTDTIFKTVSRLVIRIVDTGVDDTGRAADTEKNRVRAALEVDAPNVETIPRDIRQEVVPGVVRLVQPADAGGLADGVFLVDSGAGDAAEVTTNTGDFRARSVNQQVGVVLGTRILEELLRHN